MTSAASTSRVPANGKETALWLLERLSPGWRRLPPLLGHAQLITSGGGRGSTEALTGMLRAIAEAESQLSASRFPRALP